MTTFIAVLLLVAPFCAFLYVAVRMACSPPASVLNLTGDSTVFIDQKLPLKIAPTAADGSPASVVDIVWSLGGSALASINTTTPDLLNAELVCDEPADLVVLVTAKALDGSELSAQLEVKVEARPVIATSLNLSAGEPIPRG